MPGRKQAIFKGAITKAKSRGNNHAGILLKYGNIHMYCSGRFLP